MTKTYAFRAYRFSHIWRSKTLKKHEATKWKKIFNHVLSTRSANSELLIFQFRRCYPRLCTFCSLKTFAKCYVLFHIMQANSLFETHNNRQLSPEMGQRLCYNTKKRNGLILKLNKIEEYCNVLF